MKLKFEFLLFMFLGLLFSCKTPPVTKIKNISSLQNNLENNNSAGNKLKIYFPQFYHEDGSVINGDGIVIILPDNEILVIDGFMPEAASQYIDFIKSLNISKIDYLVATHYHSDHVGTFSSLIETFEIGQFISNGAPANNNPTKKLLSALSENNIIQKTVAAGNKITFSADCYIEVLWPTLSEEDKYNIYNNPGKTAALVNLSSLVLKLHYKDFSIIFPGDIYKKGDAALSKQYGKKLKADILKAPHHGEWYTANNFRFIKNVSPDYAIIQDNRYITKVISTLYKLAGSKILYRLTPGYILIESDGLKYKISEVSF